MGFMNGRNGNDELNRFISIITLIVILIGLFTGISIFTYIGIGLLVIQFFRMLSRNLDKRQEENDRYLDFLDSLTRKRDRARNRKNDRTHAYYKCPRCKKQLRVPRGRGRIEIHCPNCGNDFIRKT